MGEKYWVLRSKLFASIRHQCPLSKRVSRRVLYRDRRIRLSAEPILSAFAELETNGTASDDGPLLIGRRHMRSSNSWMHNIEALVSGRERCVLLVHPRDAERAGVRDGEAPCPAPRTVNISDGSN